MRRIFTTPHHRLATALVVVACALCGPSLARATTYGGDAVLLFPSARSPVQLKELSVTLQLPTVPGRWQVKVRYVLKNRGARDATLDLLLPERLCNSNTRTCRSSTAGRFHNLATTLDGAPLMEVAAKPPAGAKDGDASNNAAKDNAAKDNAAKDNANLWRHSQGDVASEKAAKRAAGRTRHFAVTVKAKKQVVLEQRYAIGRTTDSDGEIVQLLFGPEHRWHGPIAKARVSIALHQRPWTVGHTAAYAVSSYTADIPTEGPMRGAATTHLRFFNRRLRPSAPLFVHMATSADVSAARRCPDLRAVAAATTGKQAEAELKRILVMRELNALKRCRSLYLALYGFPFGSKIKRAQFYGKPVRSASATKTVTTGKRLFVRFGLQPNPTYVADLHPEAHQAYLRGLAMEIERRRTTK